MPSCWRQHVDRRLSTAHAEIGRAGRAIGRDLGPVGDDVVADDVDVVDVVAGVGAHAGRSDRRAREGARLHLDAASAATMRPSFLAPILTLTLRARGRAGGAEHLLARHRHLHRLARLLRQRDAPAARDRPRSCRRSRRRSRSASRGSARCRCRAARRRGRAPGSGPGWSTRPRTWPSSATLRQRGVRLDVALVHGLRGELALDDDLGLRRSPPRRRPCLNSMRLAMFDGLSAGGLTPSVQQVVVQDRRVGLHRLGDVDDVRQHLVVDLDQLQRLLGDRLATMAATAATAWPS